MPLLDKKLPAIHDLQGKIPADLLKKAKLAAGYSGIYIAAPRDKWPITFGVSADARNAYYSIQRGYWEEHFIHVFLLTPGPPVAARLKARMTENLAPKRQFFNESWYNATVDEALIELELAAASEGVELFDEIEAERRYYRGIQKAMEQQAGIQRTPLVAQRKLSKPDPYDSNVVLLRPKERI